MDLLLGMRSLSSWLLILVIVFQKSEGVSLKEDLTLTADQRSILVEFKENVIRYLPHEYMKADIYLIRWLRAKNFNIQAAEKMLLDNLKWREENKMDTIHDEDWSDFEASYKYFTNGRDKDGRPIAFLNLGTWDVRKAVVSGQRDRLARYIDKAVDHINVIVRQDQAEGKNVSQANLVANLAGYNLIQQGCLQCIPMYIHLVTTYEQHFPNSVDKMLILNTPTIFEVVLTAIRPFMSPATRASLKVYGTNRQEWEPIVFQEIERNQLPEEVKGTVVLEDE